MRCQFLLFSKIDWIVSQGFHLNMKLGKMGDNVKTICYNLAVINREDLHGIGKDGKGIFVGKFAMLRGEKLVEILDISVKNCYTLIL